MLPKSALVLLLFLCSSAAARLTVDVDHLLAEGEYDRVVEIVRSKKDTYLAQLIARAQQAGLDGEPEWHALLHYRKNLWGGYTSEVDGANFFTARQGHTDPAQELLTTLASFFSERPVPGSIHPTQCRFLARYTWLKKTLHFDSSRLPELPCRGFKVFYDAIEPVGLTVVFPATHPNSPSSMFGHTLIRVDSKGHNKATRMLDYTINYAAEADTGNGMAYAIKGLTGGFIGRFHIIPYHMKLREYAQMENRDIWEYKLKVSQQTVDMVLMHAWELLGTHFDYYFFTENCSYHVLTLLEADLFDYRMTDEFDSWVLPTDTLRVLDKNGLIERVDYYPSSYRTILARRGKLDAKEDRLAKTIYKSGTEANRQALDSVPVDRQAAILDMAFDYLRYRKIAAKGDLEPGLDEREKQLLVTRSQLKVVSEKLDIPEPGTRPDQGHDTARVSMGAGRDENGSFLKLGWRAVYHDWLDPAEGYSSNYALEFGQLGLRYYTGTLSGKRLKLDHLYLVNLDNFEPLDEFFTQLSWHLSTGLESVFNAADERDVSVMFRAGPGLSYRPGNGSLLAYAGVDAEIGYSDGYRNNYYLGAGPAIALMQDVRKDWRMKLTGRYLLGLGRDRHDRAAFVLDQSWRLSKDMTVNLGIEQKKKQDGWMTEGNVWFNVYY